MNNSSNSWALTISQAQSQELWHVTLLHLHSNLLRTALLIISIIQWKKLGFGDAQQLSRTLRGGDPDVSLNNGSLCLGTLGVSLLMLHSLQSKQLLFSNDYLLCSLVVLHSVLRGAFTWHCSELVGEYLREWVRYLGGRQQSLGCVLVICGIATS